MLPSSTNTISCGPPATRSRTARKRCRSSGRTLSSLWMGIATERRNPVDMQTLYPLRRSPFTIPSIAKHSKEQPLDSRIALRISIGKGPSTNGHRSCSETAASRRAGIPPLRKVLSFWHVALPCPRRLGKLAYGQLAALASQTFRGAQSVCIPAARFWVCKLPVCSSFFKHQKSRQIPISGYY